MNRTMGMVLMIFGLALFIIFLGWFGYHMKYSTNESVEKQQEIVDIVIDAKEIKNTSKNIVTVVAGNQQYTGEIVHHEYTWMKIRTSAGKEIVFHGNFVVIGE
jgi:hypothetical protein